MFIDIWVPRCFAPAEQNLWFDAFMYRYVALRWSANSDRQQVYKHLAPPELEHRLSESAWSLN